jgi:hypothetical protein
MEFNANDNGASAVDFMGSSVPDTPMVNSNPGQSKYGHTYRPTTHYDPTTGSTVGAEATALANYYQCLEEADDNVEFANIGAGIGGGFENSMELKPMKYKVAINRPDGETWAEEIENEHNKMVMNDAWEPVKKTSLPRGTKVIDSTWACKKKSKDKHLGHLNTRRFNQVECVQGVN